MKKLLVLLSIVLLLVSFTPTYALEDKVYFENRITVTSEGGVYQVGFVNIEFKKNFLGKDMDPIEIDVKVYAEDGKGYVEFTDIPEFKKSVHIKVDNYNGLLYDETEGKNVNVNIKKEQIIAPHFSRYCFNM